MANHLSALKRARQTERRTVRNRANTSSLRTQLRDLREQHLNQDAPALGPKGARAKRDELHSG